ncbi:MAG: hypothetical protein AAGF85_02635 [Bacteroidota bacterium]
MARYKLHMWPTYIVFGLLFFLIFSCENDDNGTGPRADLLQELEGSWVLGSVINDNQNVTTQFNNFQLNITLSQEFTTENGGNAWPSSGKFEIIDNDLLERDDGVNLWLEISSEGLTISFNKMNTSSRQKGITGDFIFFLIKK